MNKLSYFWQHQVDTLKEVISDVLHEVPIPGYRMASMKMAWAEQLVL